MRLTPLLRLLNNQALDALRKSIRLTIADATPYLNTVKEEKKKIMYDKLTNLNNWYTKLIGLDEVKLYQDRVTSLQEQLLTTQEKRREVGKKLSEVRQKSLELQDEIHKVKRQEDLERFLDLMKQETEVLKMENSISRTFQEYDQTERELFTAFTNAIRDSHEKQRAQVEYTKYFGLTLSIAGSFLAFVYTTVKKQDLKRFIEEKLATIDGNSEPVVLNLVQANEKTMQEVIRNREKLNEVVNVLTLELKRNRNDSHPVNVEMLQLPKGDELKVDYYKVVGGLVLGYIILQILSR